MSILKSVLDVWQTYLYSLSELHNKTLFPLSFLLSSRHADNSFIRQRIVFVDRYVHFTSPLHLVLFKFLRSPT